MAEETYKESGVYPASPNISHFKISEMGCGKHFGLRLGECDDFTTELHTKHTLQIYEKLS